MTIPITIEPLADMGRPVVMVLYVAAMAAVIVGVDFVFFRNRFWGRLTVNIGIVLVFVAFYLRFLRGSMNKGQLLPRQQRPRRCDSVDAVQRRTRCRH